MMVVLAPLVDEQRRRREERSGRLRAPGGGRKPKPFSFRLLCALTHLRTGNSLRATAAVFGVDEKSVRNWRDELDQLLDEHGIVPPGGGTPIRSATDLGVWLTQQAEADVLEYTVIDATEVACCRPSGGFEAQRPAWSGKSHDHVVKGTTLVDPAGRVVWFEANPTGEGRTHDITMLRSQTGLLDALRAAKIPVLADSGYQGLATDLAGTNDVWTPYKRSKRNRLSRDEHVFNHSLAVARIRVEHGIGAMKRWGAMRRHQRHPDTFGVTGRSIATIASIIA